MSDRQPRDTDQNFSHYAVGMEGLQFCDVRETAAAIEGLPGGPYCRIPEDWLGEMTPNVRALACNTSGGVVRFVTDSPRVGLRMKLASGGDMPHMPRTGSSGMDVYLGTGSEKRYVNTLKPLFDEDFYEGATVLPGGRTEVTVYLPLYNGVKLLEVGIEPGAVVESPSKLTYEAPIAFYGSSITQGGCACRTSTCYPAVVCRRLDAKLLNLGFSGSALGEQPLAEFIATLEMSCLVYDYDNNAPDSEHLRRTHLPFIRTILERRPELPVVFLSKTNYDPNDPDDAVRRRLIYASYRWAEDNGYRAAFVDGSKLFGEDAELCTVDSLHPNDLGFYFMGRAVIEAVRGVIR